MSEREGRTKRGPGEGKGGGGLEKLCNTYNIIAAKAHPSLYECIINFINNTATNTGRRRCVHYRL